jgi:hypothetical protein
MSALMLSETRRHYRNGYKSAQDRWPSMPAETWRREALLAVVHGLGLWIARDVAEGRKPDADMMATFRAADARWFKMADRCFF